MTCKLVTDSIKVSILKRIYDYIPVLVETGSFIVTVLPPVNRNKEDSTENFRIIQWTGHSSQSIAVSPNTTTEVTVNAVVTNMGLFEITNLYVFYFLNDKKTFLEIPKSLYICVNNCISDV